MRRRADRCSRPRACGGSRCVAGRTRPAAGRSDCRTAFARQSLPTISVHECELADPTATELAGAVLAGWMASRTRGVLFLSGALGAGKTSLARGLQIGSASCRERECHFGEFSVGALFTKKNKI